MDNQEIKDLFDRAYKYLNSGKVGMAASSFELIIKRYESSNPLAASIADQRLRWYCMPIEQLFARMNDTSSPINIREIVLDLFSEEDLSDNNIQFTIDEIERKLLKIAICEKIGEHLWVRTEEFNKCVKKSYQIINSSTEPVSISTLIKDYWSEFASGHPDFPDSTSIAALANSLKGYQIHIIADQYALSYAALKQKIQSFADQIQNSRIPKKLDDSLDTLFPEFIFNPDNRRLFKEFLHLHFDKHFVEVSPGLWITKSLLNFGPNVLDDIFIQNPFPLKISDLIAKLFFIDQKVPHLKSSFVQQVQEQLKKYRDLHCVGKNFWLNDSVLKNLYEDVVHYLQQSKSLVSSAEIRHDLLKLRWKVVASNDKLQSALWNLVKNHLKSHPQVISIADDYWLNKEIITFSVDKIYDWLLEQVDPQSTMAIVSYAIGLPTSIKSGTHSLVEEFNQVLKGDSRFFYYKRTKSWKAISPTAVHNDMAFEVLQAEHRPLNHTKLLVSIREQFLVEKPRIDLAGDARFRNFNSNLWGLKDWVLINDWAYQYLLEYPEALPASTIIGSVCQEHHLSQDFAIFMPDSDSRFIRVSGNTWRSVRRVTDEEVQRMLDYVSKQVGIGIHLDELVQKVLFCPDYITDAGEKLTADDRFMQIEDKWFARAVVFRELNPEDIDSLYEYIRSLDADRLPVTTKSLIFDVLSIDYRFTDAEARLKEDPRFEEFSKGMWVYQGYTPPDIERTTGTIAPAGGISADTDWDEWNDDVLFPDKLTLRKIPKKPNKTAEKPDHVNITLTYLDIRHHNIRISGSLSRLIDVDERAITLTDDHNQEWTGRIDTTHSLLDIGDWFLKRGLTYGDKIRIEPRVKGGLRITPRNERDEKVFQEASKYKNVENLIAEAKQVRKTYHDLMIEVMKTIGEPLHREDLYQLVDYQRTAKRSTINQILSLTDCPYEELRYFVPHGRGYWSYNEERKKAFDMKMKELEEQVQSLEEELGKTDVNSSQLQTLKSQHKQEIQQIKSEYEKKIASLKKEKESLTQEAKQYKDLSSDLQGQLAPFKEENQKLEGQNQDLLRQLQTTQQILKEHEDQFEQFAHDSRSLNDKITTLEQEKARIQESNTALEGKITTLSAQVDDLLRDSKQEITNSRDQELELLEKNRLLEQHSFVDKSQIAKLDQESQELQAELTEKVQQNEGVSAKLVDLTEQFQELKQQYAELQSNPLLESLQNQVEEQKKAIQALQEQKEELLTTRLDQEQKLANQAGQIENLSKSEQSFKNIQSQKEEEILSLQSKVQTLEETLQTRQDQAEYVDQLTLQLKAAQQQLAELERSQSLIKETQLEQVQELEKQLAKVQERVEEKDKEIKGLNIRLNQIMLVLSSPLGRLFARITNLSV